MTTAMGQEGAGQQQQTQQQHRQAAGPTHYSEIPQDARLISLIIASMGIEDIEPGVEMMLLEWANRYISTILSDSLLYAAHAHPSTSSNPTITLSDLILAIQSHLSHSLIQQPSKSTLLSLASSLNSTPLPPISDRYGLRLPPREQCLANVNFRIVPDPLDDDDEEEDEEEDEDEAQGDAADGTGQRAGGVNGSDPQGVQQQSNMGGTTNGRGEVGEEDADDEETGLADVSMGDGAATGASPSEAQIQQDSGVDRRGVKRSLDEDDDYD